MTSQLEGRYALALFVTLETDIVILDGFPPRTCQFLGRSCKETRFPTFFLNHHVPLLIALKPVDIGIDGGIAPIEEQFGLRQLRKGLIGIRIVHAIVLLLGTVPHRIIDEVTAFLAVRPHVVAIPHNLWCPYTIDGTPILIDTFCLRVTEDAKALAVVEGLRLPVYQVVARQQVDAVVVPLSLFLQVLKAPHIHVRADHQIARAVMLSADISITRSTFYSGYLMVAEDGVAIQQIVKVEAVATQRVCCPRPRTVVHVTIQVTIVTLLEVALTLLCHHADRQQHGYQQERKNSFHIVLVCFLPCKDS